MVQMAAASVWSLGGCYPRSTRAGAGVTAVACPGGEGEAGAPVTVVLLPGRRAAAGRPQGRPLVRRETPHERNGCLAGRLERRVLLLHLGARTASLVSAECPWQHARVGSGPEGGAG